MKVAIEIALLIISLAGVIGGVVNRVKLSKGIGVRFIQYLGLVILIPLTVILSLEDRISREMTGAIVAAAVGGVLASVGKDDNN